MPHHIVAQLAMGGYDFTYKAYLVGWDFMLSDGTKVKFSAVEFYAKKNDNKPLWSGFLGWVDKMQNVVTYAASEKDSYPWMNEHWEGGISLSDKQRARFIVHEAVTHHVKRESHSRNELEFLPKRLRVALNPEEERPVLPISDETATLGDDDDL